MSSIWHPRVLVERFLSLLEDATDQATPPSVRDPAAEAVNLGTEAEREAVERKLREVIARKPPTSGGRVQLLNLSSLKDRYPDRWPILSEKLDQFVGMTLRRRLARDDVFTRCGDGIYAIVFDRLPEPEAKLKCALIAEELLAKLVGQDAGINSFGVASAATRIDNSLEVEGYTRLEALEQVLEHVEQYTAGAAGPGGAPTLEAVHELIEVTSRDLAAWQADPAQKSNAAAFGQAEYLSGILRQAAAVLQDRAGATSMALPASPDISPGEPQDPTWDSGSRPEQVAALTDQLADMQAKLASLIEQTEAKLAARHRSKRLDAAALEAAKVVFRYEPGWYVPSKVIGNFRCLPGLEIDGKLVTGSEILPTDADPRLLATLDRLVLHQAIGDIQALLARQEQSTVAVSVHHSTLMRMASRQAYQEVCERIDSAVRKSLVWEIVDPVIGFANSYLPAAISLLQKHGRAVTVRLDLDLARFDEFAGLGVHAVGVDLTGLSIPEADLIAKLNLFRSRSERHGLKAFANGLESLSATTAVIFAGFEYVAGPAIAELVDEPMPILFFDLAALYSRAYR